MRDRDLGSMGEDTFKLWCSSAGMDANGSLIDKNGWDFYVEFPFPEDTEKKLELDEKVPPVECKVQVKATDSKKNSMQIKLSNLHKLIKFPGPAFLCVICFDHKATAQRAHLVHMDKSIMERVLKRLRELSVAGEENEHKKSLSITFKGHDLSALNGATLKARILEEMRGDPASYTKTKQRLIETLGYENGTDVMHFTVSEGNPIQDMVDLTLGLREEVTVSSCSTYKTRFGVKSSTPILDGAGVIKITPKPISDAIVSFQADKFSAPICFSAQLYSSPLNSFVDKQYAKVRVATDYFDVVISPNTGAVNITLAFFGHESYPLKDAYNFFQMLRMMSKESGCSEVRLTLSSENKSNFSVVLTPGDEGLASDEKALSICKKALGIVSHFDLHDLKVQVAQLHQFNKGIEMLHMVMCENVVPSAVSCSFSTKEKLELGASRKCACVWSVSTLIGGYAFSAIVVAIGDVLETGDSKETQMNFNSFETTKTFFCKREETDQLNERIEAEITSQANALEERDITAVVMEGGRYRSSSKLSAPKL